MEWIHLNTIIYNILRHIYRQWQEDRLPATHMGNKVFFRFWIPVKTGEGIEKEVQLYYLYEQDRWYLLTTSKRKFDILITPDGDAWKLKWYELKVINDFISKLFNV